MSKDDPVNTKLSSYEVHSASAERVLRDFGRMLKDAIPRGSGLGFTLFIFDYGSGEDPGNLFYISSAQREDMLKSMKEFIRKMEGEPRK